MTVFSYQARSTQGQALSGQMEAASEAQAADQLSANGLVPLRIQPIRDDKSKGGSGDIDLAQFLPRKVSASDLILFTQQMRTLIKSGVPILQGMRRLAETANNPLMRETLAQVLEHLESGRELSGALARHPDIFSSLYVNMIRMGETTGRLDEAFQRLNQFIERDQKTAERVKSAVRYPIMVIVAIAIAVGVLTVMVIPTFARVFKGLRVELPLATRIIIGSSEFVSLYWPYLLIGLAAGVIGFRSYIRSEKGRHWWDRAKLRIPIVGKIIERASIARFARAFAMASRSGVPIDRALGAIALATDNYFMGEKIRSIRNGIERGEGLTRSFAVTGMFPPLVLQMLSTGEESGCVDEMMDDVADYYDHQVDYDLAHLSSYIEPVLILIVGGMVLVLALGIFLPMWELTRMAGRG